MRVLITGFTPFPGRPTNSSQEIVEAIRENGLSLPKFEIVSEVLPVEYQGVEFAFDHLIQEIDPDLVLSFGVARHMNTLRLETVGVNSDNASIPDNAGVFRQNQPIIDSGPPEILNPMHLTHLESLLNQQGVPSELSSDAGRYVCNHLLYYASFRQSAPQNHFQFLFTHVPTRENGFQLDLTLKGVEVMIEWYNSYN